METTVPATTPVTLDEIIFEHRNKEYGAYELRKTYNATVNRAMWIGITLFSGLFITSYIFAHQKDNKKEDYGVVITLQDIPPEEKEVLIEKPKEPEPPKEVQPKKEVQYMDIKVVENTETETPPPTQSEIDDAIISTKNVEGDKVESITETPPTVAPPETKVAEVEESNEAFLSVESMPSFAGGLSEMYKFLGKTLKYPSAAQRSGVQGRVYMSFIIEKDGSITDVQVVKSVGFGLDEEATRVVKLMPKWIPGKQNGRNVRVKFTIPVTFKLE